jgi:hypothetical protein
MFLSVRYNEICEGGNTTLHSEVLEAGGKTLSNGNNWLQSLIDLSLANSPDYTTEALEVGSYTYRQL